MRKLLFTIVALLAVAAMILGGCNNEATPSSSQAETSTAADVPQDGGILRIIGTEGPSGSIGIPENMRGMAGGQCVITIESLLLQNAAGKVFFVLATDYKWDDDYKTITLTLRQGVKFHDGTTFDAEAVKWNFDQRMAANVDGTENIESYKVVDDYTFQITIKSYQNTWLGKLGGTLGMMISPSWVEKMGVDYVNWHPAATGPFKFKDYKENEYWETERFDDYWGDRPHLDGVKYIFIADPVTAQIAFQAGKGDVISVMSGGPKMAQDLLPLGFKVEVAAGGLASVFIPSVTNPDSPLANLKVREAIEYAIDRVKIAQTVGLGYYSAMYQYAGTVQAPFDPNFKGREYDPDKARELLNEAGYPNGFQTKLICGTHLAGDELALVQANLKDVGIDAEIELVSVGKWIELETNGWPEGLLESPSTLVTDYGTTILRYLVRPTEPNWARGIYWDSLYRPDELENLVQQYLVIPDIAGQTAKAKEIVKVIYDNACIIPLWNSNGVTIVQQTVHDRTLGDDAPIATWNYTGCWLSE